MKHNRSITAAARIHSRRILSSLSDVSRFSSTIEILDSSRSNKLVSTCSFGAGSSAVDLSLRLRSLSMRRLFSVSLLLFSSKLNGCLVVRNDNREASRSQISRLAWKKQDFIDLLSRNRALGTTYYIKRFGYRRRPERGSMSVEICVNCWSFVVYYRKWLVNKAAKLVYSYLWMLFWPPYVGQGNANVLRHL